eukprot:Nk52_evm26s1705 gene=Nk52_evmTU26s1705
MVVSPVGKKEGEGTTAVAKTGEATKKGEEEDEEQMDIEAPVLKPEIPHQAVIEMINALYGCDVVGCKALPGYDDQNLMLTDKDGSSYVLKISHPDYYNTGVLRLQMEMQAFVSMDESARCPKPKKTLTGELIVNLPHKGTQYLGRLVSYLEGDMIRDHYQDANDEFFVKVGEFVGDLSKSLSSFDNKVKEFDWLWDAFTGPPQVVKHTKSIKDEQRRDLAVKILRDRYEETVKPAYSELRSGYVHNDVNLDNLVVRKHSDKLSIVGVIDFGDALYRKYVVEPSVTIAYFIQGAKDPFQVAKNIFKGYHRRFPLTDKEITVLYPLVTMRLMISATMSAVKAEQYPDSEYMIRCAEPTWEIIETIEKKSVQEWTNMFIECASSTSTK